MASPALQSLGIESLGPRYQAAVDASAAADKKVEQSLADKNAALAPVEEKIQATNAAVPPAPKLDNIGAMNFQHHGLDPKAMNESIQTMLAFAAIGGAMTRTPMTAALNAFSKGIEGLVKGDQELFKRETQEFDRHLKAAIAKNTQAIEEYKMAQDKHKGDLNGLMTEWRLIAAKHQDTVALAQFESQNAKGAMQHIENLVKMDQAARRTDQQFSMTIARFNAAQQAAERKAWTVMVDAKTNSLVRLNQQTGEIQPIGGSEGLIRPGTKAPGAAGGAGSNVRSSLVLGAAANSLNRLNEIETHALESGEKPKVSLIFGNHPDSIMGKGRDALIRSGLSEEQQKTDALYGSMIDEAIPVFTGGLRGSDAFRKFLVGQLPQQGDDDKTVDEKLRVFKANIEGMQHTFSTNFKNNPANWGPGENPKAAPAAATPPVNAKGWKLMTDAAGNKAYVGPNNEIEEVQ